MVVYGQLFMIIRGICRLNIDKFFYGSWYANCYVISCTDKYGDFHSAVIDPAYPAKDLIKLTDSFGSKIDAIILTHGHFDHVYFLDELKQATNATIYIHANDAEMLSDSRKNAYSVFFNDTKVFNQADKLVEHGDIIKLGNEKIKVIATPGHSKGSMCLNCGDFIITGDTLFDDGCGRYDLYGGDSAALVNSLKKLNRYDHDLMIYPGHGIPTTLGQALDNLYT